MKHEEEQLYICDYAGMPTCRPDCPGNKPYGIKKDPIVCGYTKVLVKHIPYTPPEDEAEDPALQRVAVIWFGEVPVSDLDKTYSICLNDEAFSGKFISDVELIDADRVTIETLELGQIIIIMNKPAQETVEDVLKDMPDEHTRAIDNDLHIFDLHLYLARLRKAKEREGK